MRESDYREPFFVALRDLVTHLIERGCSWYEPLIRWLVAFDRGEWQRLSDEHRKLLLEEFERDIIYRRDGLGEFMEGSEALDVSKLHCLTTALVGYRTYLATQTQSA